MKIIKSIKISEPDWATLLEQIKKDYPRSVWLSRNKMRRTLGFVDRFHSEWIESEHQGYTYNPYKISFLEKSVYLDFYDEKKKTVFLIKYSNYLESKND